MIVKHNNHSTNIFYTISCLAYNKKSSEENKKKRKEGSTEKNTVKWTVTKNTTVHKRQQE